MSLDYDLSSKFITKFTKNDECFLLLGNLTRNAQIILPSIKEDDSTTEEKQDVKEYYKNVQDHKVGSLKDLMKDLND